MRTYTVKVALSEDKVEESSVGEEKVKTAEWSFTVPSVQSHLPKVSTLKYMNEVLMLYWWMKQHGVFEHLFGS
jgi:hypothetical protein